MRPYILKAQSFFFKKNLIKLPGKKLIATQFIAVKAPAEISLLILLGEGLLWDYFSDCLLEI